MLPKSENSNTAKTSDHQANGKSLKPISLTVDLLKIYSLKELLLFLKSSSLESSRMELEIKDDVVLPSSLIFITPYLITL